MLQSMVINVMPLDNFMLLLKFDTCEIRIFDVKPYIKCEYYGKLLDIEYFNDVKIRNYTVEWRDEQDISPYELYNSSTEANDCKSKIMNIHKIHFDSPSGENGYLSSSYISEFKYKENTFNSVKQFMCYNKAMYFCDCHIANEILKEYDLYDIEKLGNSISNYNKDIWNTVRLNVLYEGTRLKFTSNKKIKRCLLETGNACIIDYSDVYNTLGTMLMDIRKELTDENKNRSK